MKKSILNLGKSLNKKTQKEINGGGRVPSCPEVCPSAPRGTKCGPRHCPGECDGYGGYMSY
ncbi:hypothetical protein OAT18_02400 [Tenacibaculum sp.]|nr:hypothetical protein [Tenacibaculum sp.]